MKWVISHLFIDKLLAKQGVFEEIAIAGRVIRQILTEWHRIAIEPPRIWKLFQFSINTTISYLKIWWKFFRDNQLLTSDIDGCVL